MRVRPDIEEDTEQSDEGVVDVESLFEIEPAGANRISATRHPIAALRQLATELGPAGLFPIGVLMGLAAVERFDFVAFGVLAPEIRHQFHLSNKGIDGIIGLTNALPILLAVFVGWVADRGNRVRLTRVAGVIWGFTAILTGLAPTVLVLVGARLAGGVGLLVNEPVHPSLLSDYYPPAMLPRANALHRQSATIGLLGGPLAGFLAIAVGWRSTFVVLALPTFVLVAFTLRLREPRRGASLPAAAAAAAAAEDPDNETRDVSLAEGYRQVRSIRSLRRTWLAAFLFGGGTLPFAGYLNLFFHDTYHVGPAVRGLISFAFGVGGFVGLLIGARLSEKRAASHGPGVLSVINGLMVVEFAVGIGLMAMAPTLWTSAALVLILGIGASGFLPPYLTMVALVAPPALRSQAYAWSLLWYGLGAIISSQIIGALADAHGQRVALIVVACLTGAGGLVELTARSFVQRDIDQALNAETTSETEGLLVCRKLDVAYDSVQVLFGVDLEIMEGEIVALLGTNGAGKSTLLKAISGLLDPIGGACWFDGRDITHADTNTTARLGIAQVPGGRGVFPTLSVAENLRVAGWMYRKDPGYVREATDRVLEYFPVLRDRWDTAAGSLSGGEQQMLSLGQAFIAQPKLMLIDELSLGLAPTVVEKLLEIVRAIHANGTTIILVEQSVNLALRLAHRAFFLEKGEVRFSGPTAELLERTDILRAVFLKGAAAEAADHEAGVLSTGPSTKGSSTNGSMNGSSANGRARPARAAAVRAKREAEAEAAHRSALLAAPAVLETAGLSKRYGGVSAVNGVDLTLHDGEILGLIGPNGAGKTTIFDLICGFTPSNGGRVVLNGEDVTDWPSNRRAAAGLGRSFQDARLWSSLTVREAIAVGLEREVEVTAALPALLGMTVVSESERRVMAQVDELIALMGLWAFRNKFISELSTGSRRIVEIAVILGHRPSVVLLDEPSSGIAQKETEALGPLLKQAQEYLGCSMLIIEHDMPLITKLADHLVALERGAVVTHGSPAEVLQHPRVIESYLGTGDEENLLEP